MRARWMVAMVVVAAVVTTLVLRSHDPGGPARVGANAVGTTAGEHVD